MSTAVSNAPRNESQSKEAENYYLKFDDDAKLRLSQQNDVTREMMGGIFLSEDTFSFLKSLQDKNEGERLRICDIGTGPGDWLFDIQSQLRKTGINPILHGYDLFPIHFPSQEQQDTSDIHFFELNIHDKSTFPTEKEKYDFVHIRYLAIAITGEQWKSAFENCISILKPGGIMMWEEILFDKFEINNRQKYQYATKIFDMEVELFQRQGRILDCSPKLQPLFTSSFKAATWQNFSTTNLSQDWQRLQAKNMYMVTREMLLKTLERGEDGIRGQGLELGSVEEGYRLLDRAMEDYRDGCLTNMTIRQWVGEGKKD